MLNKIIHFSLLNRVAVLIITGLIIVAGCLELTRAEIDIFPDLDAPTVVVMTEAPGLAPEEVERLVTFPVETAMTGASGVRRTRSASSTGFSVVWVEFDWDTDIYRARQTVSERLASAESQLPPGVGTPVMGPQSSILGEILIIGFTPDSTSVREVRKWVDRDITRRLLGVKGVAQVSVIGGEETEMQVLLSPEKMKFYGVKLADVTEALEGSNADAAGSVIYSRGNEYIVKGDIATKSVEDVALLAVPAANGSMVRLADIARVEYGGKKPRLGTASVKGEESVLVTVTKQPGVGTIQLTDELEQALADAVKNLSADVKVSTDIFRQADFIDNSISNLQSALLEGALMVIIVLFFFLMNLRTTLVSVIALPVSVIVTILILRALGLAVNTMTLGGIAIAIGSLVDDAIVDVENTYRRLRENMSLPRDSRQPVLKVVFKASTEVRKPIFNSSLIIIAGFLPLFFLSGMEGRMLTPLGIAFIVALAASTVVALTLTPVLCSYLLGTAKEDKALSKEPRMTRAMKRGYRRALQWCLAHPKPLLWGTGSMFAVAVALFFTLGRGFLPGFNEGSLTINVSTLPGISLA